MYSLNSVSTTTIKDLNLDLSHKGGPYFCATIFFQIQNVLSQTSFGILEKFFRLSTPLQVRGNVNLKFIIELK